MALAAAAGRSRFRRTRTVAAAVVGVFIGLAAGASLAVAAAPQKPQPFPETLPATCDNDPRVRKEVGSLTAAEWATYQRAVMGLHARETSAERASLDWFERFVQLHGESARKAHGGTHFLAWHRLFLLAYENALRTVEPNATIPYWDWSMDAADPGMAPVWQARELGAAKRDAAIHGGAFDKFHVDTIHSAEAHDVERGFDSGKPGKMLSFLAYPDKAVIKSLWEEPTFNFSMFSWALETEHNLVHVGVGGFSDTANGDMLSLRRAAGDVVFWSHHAFIDYIWSMRQTRFPKEVYAGTQNGSPIALDDVMEPFAIPAEYAVKLGCIKYVADARSTRTTPVDAPPPTVVPSPETAREAAYLSCTSNRQCGCGTCVKGACVITVARTALRCRAPATCVRHPNKTRRQLICRCQDKAKCECTKSAHCGCGVCRRWFGKCYKPRGRRRALFCGPTGWCVRRDPTVKRFVCIGGARCRKHEDCGCARCYRRRCVTRAKFTLKDCGAGHKCVRAGATFACKLNPLSRVARAPAAAVAAVGLDAVRRPAGPLTADSEASLVHREDAAIAKFQAVMSTTVDAEARALAVALEEANEALAEADADSDAVEVLAMEAKEAKKIAKPSSRLAALGRATLLSISGRARGFAGHKIPAAEVKANTEAHTARMVARKALFLAKKDSRKRVRDAALTGFNLINNLDARASDAKLAVLEALETKVETKEEAVTAAAAEQDEDAELEDGDMKEKEA